MSRFDVETAPTMLGNRRASDFLRKGVAAATSEAALSDDRRVGGSELLEAIKGLAHHLQAHTNVVILVNVC
eukprot:SAG31_NODE_27711_length_421_cov_0.968944_1_plen_70_part_01